MRRKLVAELILLAISAVSFAEDVNPSAWHVRTNVDPISDEKSFVAAVLSDSGTGLAGDPVGFALLEAQGRTQIAIVWGHYLGSNFANVTYRFDNDRPITESWMIAGSGDSTVRYRPGENPSAFIQRLSGARILAVRVDSYSDGLITAVFKVDGLEEATMGYPALHDAWFSSAVPSQ